MDNKANFWHQNSDSAFASLNLEAEHYLECKKVEDGYKYLGLGWDLGAADSVKRLEDDLKLEMTHSSSSPHVFLHR